MPEEFLGERRKALEETFFAKENEKLRRELQQQRTATEKRSALRAASGISNDALLERLLDLGIESQTLAALSLVPLVAVAWADGSVDPRERDAVLRAAEASGISRGDVSHGLLQGWLGRRPARGLLDTWKDYVGALASQLSVDARDSLEEEILGRARSVASQAGGFLGLGRRVSAEEEAVLRELAEAFAAVQTTS